MSEILCFGFTIFAIAVAQFIPDIPENTFLNAVSTSISFILNKITYVCKCPTQQG